MKVHCEQGSNRELETFALFLQSRSADQGNQESNQNLSNNDLELLAKFQKFLAKESFKHHKHAHKDGKHGWHGKHGWQGKHGKHFGHHCGMHFGHHGAMHFGPHGGKHFGKHGRHGGKHGKHDHGHGHGHGPWGRKHFWSYFTMVEQIPQGGGDHNIEREVENGRNPSPPPACNTAGGQANNEQCNWCDSEPRRHWGRRFGQLFGSHRRDRCIAAPIPTTTQNTQTEQARNEEVPQENLATMVENINIENSPRRETD